MHPFRSGTSALLRAMRNIFAGHLNECCIRSTFVHRLEGVYCRKEDSKFMVRLLAARVFHSIHIFDLGV